MSSEDAAGVGCRRGCGDGAQHRDTDGDAELLGACDQPARQALLIVALLLDRHWNHVAWNESARLTLNTADADRNCLVAFFRHTRYRRGKGRTESCERIAPSVVAAFRAAAAGHSDDEGFQKIISELQQASSEFAELWARQDVRSLGVVLNEVEHPVVGTLSFESTQLKMPARPDLTVVRYNPVEGTDTEQKVRWLLSEVDTDRVVTERGVNPFPCRTRRPPTRRRLTNWNAAGSKKRPLACG